MRKTDKKTVFINCPFDEDYLELFRALVFTIHDCGFNARCALEIDDSGLVRLNKIASIIKQCNYGIHDLTRTELDKVSNLPRFNMPLELGIFLGAKIFGDGKNKLKCCLVLDRDQYRYQKFISDIAGQDIKAHNNAKKMIITKVRDWLSNNTTNGSIMPSGSFIYNRYRIFKKELPATCKNFNLKNKDLLFNDFKKIVTSWILINSYRT